MLGIVDMDYGVLPHISGNSILKSRISTLFADSIVLPTAAQMHMVDALLCLNCARTNFHNAYRVANGYEKQNVDFIFHEAHLPLYDNAHYVPVPIGEIYDIPLGVKRDMIYFGRMIKEKAIREVVILSARCGLRSTLLGDFEDPMYKMDIQNVIAEYKADVIMLPAMQPSVEFYTILAEHKVFCLLSTDCYCISLLDALSLGLDAVVYMHDALAYTWAARWAMFTNTRDPEDAQLQLVMRCALFAQTDRERRREEVIAAHHPDISRRIFLKHIRRNRV